MTTTDTLARRATVVELVRVYQQAVDEIRASFLMIDSALKRMDAAFAVGEYRSFHLRDNCHHYVDFDNPERTLEGLRRDTWHQIVNKLEIRAMLSVARANELDNLLERGDLPEITEASVRAFAAKYYGNLDGMLREAVEEVFDFLRPRHSEHKTNTEYELGRKVILTYVLDSTFLKHFRVRGYWEPRLAALENVFTALDGKGQIHKGFKSELQMAIECVELGSNGKFETDYFEGRCFRNSNLHLTFKRLDLVDRLNKIAGGKRLGRAA